MTVFVKMWGLAFAGTGFWGRRLAPSLVLVVAGSCAGDGRTESLDGERTTLVGVLEKYVVDYADGSHRNAYALRQDDGVRVELASAELPALRSGDRVVVQGWYVSDREPLSSRDGLRLASTRFSVEQAAPQHAALGVIEQALVAPPQVTVRSAIVLLNFKGQAPQSYSAATARKELKEVEDYYLDMSYDSWHMVSDVFGPYEVDTPSACNLDVIAPLAKNTARAQGVAIDGYDHVAVKIPGIEGMDCPCGVAFVGNPPARGAIRNGGTSLYTCGGANAFAHELGHGLGLDHSSTAPCNGAAYRPGLTGCDVVEYGNAYNSMGNGLGHFNAAQKATLGWLNGCNIQRVSKDAEFDLTAIQLGVDDKPQGLQIATGDTRAGGPLYFYVEYRNPALTTFNAKEGSTVREKGPGLHVTVSRDFREKNGEGKTILIDASSGLKGLPTDGQTTKGDPRMVVGDTFKPNDNVTIQLVSRTEETAKVKVSFAGGGSGTNACQPSKVPPGPGSVPDGYAAMVFADCDYGGTAVNLREGKYTTAELKALGVKDNDVSSLVLASGYDALLYVNDNFGGKSVTRAKSLMCFNDIDMNDALSSIEIRKSGMAPDKDAGSADAAVPTHDGGVDAGSPGRGNDSGVVANDAGAQPARDASAATADGGDVGVVANEAGPQPARDAGTATADGGDVGHINDDGDDGDDGAHPKHNSGCSVAAGAQEQSSGLLLALGTLSSLVFRRRSKRLGAVRRPFGGSACRGSR